MKAYIYKTLRVLLEKPNETQFEMLFNSFLCKLEEELALHDFKAYFVSHYVYRKKYAKASPTAITDIKNFKVETLVYSSTPVISDYNSKIMIYNQYKNIKTKTKNEDDFLEIDAKYDDLSRRMRIEVSKKIEDNCYLDK